MLRKFGFLLIAALPLAAQSPGHVKFPQHSTGWPAGNLLPPPTGHAAGLSATIIGKPMLASPGSKPIYPGGGGVIFPPYGGFGNYWYPPPPVVMPPVVWVNQAAPAAQSVTLVTNPDYKPEVAKPVLTEYSAVSKPYENFVPAEKKVFLLALKDGSLRQAVAFWREADTLHFVLPTHKQEKVAVADLDRESTKRFNAERGIQIQLPE